VIERMLINIIYDRSVNNAPAAFKADVQAAVNFLDSLFTNNITINIHVGWGEVDNQNLVSGALGESIFNTATLTYQQIYNAFQNNQFSADQKQAFASLPAMDPTGTNAITLSTAEEKALGLIAGNSTAIDGWVGFSKTVSWDFSTTNRSVPGQYDLLGVIEHEVTEVMGRFSDNGGFSPMDLFRYSACSRYGRACWCLDLACCTMAAALTSGSTVTFRLSRSTCISAEPHFLRLV